jgi:hypothetical protein
LHARRGTVASLASRRATHRCTRNVEEPEGIALDCVVGRWAIGGAALAHAWR